MHEIYDGKVEGQIMVMYECLQLVIEKSKLISGKTKKVDTLKQLGEIRGMLLRVKHLEMKNLSTFFKQYSKYVNENMREKETE